MKRMWLPHIMDDKTGLMRDASYLIGGLYDGEVVYPGWVDVEKYPTLEKVCWTEQEYAIRRLCGDPL